MDTQTPPGADSTPANDTPLSVREAVESFAARREATPEPKQPEAKAPEKEPDEPAAIENSSDDEDNTAPDDNPTSGDDDQSPADPDADEGPSVEPPRSWTKEEKEAFKLLPPEHQQRIADRERNREVEIRRGQNEVAEKNKALEAKLSEADKTRLQYEAALPQLLQQLNAQRNAEFADIQSQADVVRLADEDPLRYIKWQALQQQGNAAQQEHAKAQLRQQQEAKTRFDKWASEQDETFSTKYPEFKDPVKVEKFQKEAIGYLKEELGWSEDRIGKLWNGAETISLRDAAVQQTIRDAARWRAAQAAAKAAPKQSLPPVQRPGTASTKGDAQATHIKNLETRLDRATTTRDQIAIAAQIRQAKRESAR